MKHVLVIAVAVLTACGGGGGGGYDDGPGTPTGPSNPTNPGTPSQSASVEMRSTEQGGEYGGGTYNHAFSPTQVTVVRGGTVTWSNGSGFAHSVNFTSAGAPSDINAFDSGSASRAFQTAGTFSYRCDLHAGMSGTVVVQ